jgi:hypothetical protein
LFSAVISQGLYALDAAVVTEGGGTHLEEKPLPRPLSPERRGERDDDEGDVQKKLSPGPSPRSGEGSVMSL